MSHRLGKLLRSRGAAPDVVDDVVQEVAARVLAKGIVFEDAMDLMRWAVPVALNLLVDNARAGQRVTAVPEDFDSEVADVADLVAHRDRLRRVLGALPQLSAADRAALTGGEVAVDRKEAVRLAVRRHRARRRLLALVDGVAAFVALVAGLLRRTGRAAVTATVAIAVVPVAFVTLPGAPAAEPAAPVVEVAIEVERPVRRAPAASRVAPRPAEAAKPAVARPAGPDRPAAPAAPRSTPVKVEHDDSRVLVGSRDRTQSDGLVCVRRAGVVDELCVHEPRGSHNGRNLL